MKPKMSEKAWTVKRSVWVPKQEFIDGHKTTIKTRKVIVVQKGLTFQQAVTLRKQTRNSFIVPDKDDTEIVPAEVEQAAEPEAEQKAALQGVEQ